MMLQIWVYILLLFIPIIPQMQESLCFCCISAAECRLPHTVFFTVKTIVKWIKISLINTVNSAIFSGDFE